MVALSSASVCVCAVVVGRQTDRQVRLLLLACLRLHCGAPVACLVGGGLHTLTVLACAHGMVGGVSVRGSRQGRAGTTAAAAAAARRGKPSQPRGCTNAQTHKRDHQSPVRLSVRAFSLVNSSQVCSQHTSKQAHTHTPQCSIHPCMSLAQHNTLTHNTHHTSCMHNHSQLSQISQLCSPLRCVLTSHDVTVTQARACDDVSTVVGCGMAVHVNKQQQKQQKEGSSVAGCAVHKNQGTTNKPTASLLTRNKVCAW